MKGNPLMKYYYESNDAYFRKHLQKLVEAHGGEVGGHCWWLADRSGARSGTQKADHSGRQAVP
jgi:hypothetical protein